MEITVERKYKKPAYTIDKWYINGVFFSDGLEDTDRGLTSTMTLEEINDTFDGEADAAWNIG